MPKTLLSPLLLLLLLGLRDCRYFCCPHYHTERLQGQVLKEKAVNKVQVESI